MPIWILFCLKLNKNRKQYSVADDYSKIKNTQPTFNLENLINSNTYEEIKTNLSLVGSPRKNKNCEDDFKIYKDEITSILKKLEDLTRFENIEEIKKRGNTNVKSYICMTKLKDYSNIPSTLIITGNVDSLKDEAKEYYNKLVGNSNKYLEVEFSSHGFLKKMDKDV